MEIEYKVLQSMKAGDNQSLIQYLDKILNHNVTDKVWNWEFNTMPDTIFTVAKDGEQVVGTQSMLPLSLTIAGEVTDTAKSETSYLDANYRGKQIFEKLYQLAVDKIVEKGSKVIWGFTPALKAWKKNLGFHTFDDEMLLSKTIVGQYSFAKNKHKSRNAFFAAGKTLLYTGYHLRYKMLQAGQLKLNSNIVAKNKLNNAADMQQLYSTINKKYPQLIHLDMSEAYVNWRVNNNPAVQYRQLYFYSNNTLVGYVLYSIKDDTLIIADITYNLDEAVLRHMIKYVVDNNSGFYLLQYWGNKSNEINKIIFKVLSGLKGNTQVDTSRNFVYKVFSEKHENDTVNSLGNWYMNGLWTEGFHI